MVRPAPGNGLGARAQGGARESLGWHRVGFHRRLLVIAVLGFLARAAFLVLEPEVDLRGDEPSWIAMAEHGLVKIRHPLSPWSPRILFYPPVYPYFLAVGYWLSGGHVAALWAQAGISALLIPAVGFLGARAFSRRTGIYAAAAVAFYPELLWFAAHYWSETLFLTFLYWGLERALAADETGRGGPALASGVLLGLASLTRETSLPMPFLASAWQAWPRGRGAPRGLKRASLLLLGTALVVGPWTARNWIVFKAFIPVSTYGALNLWMGNSPLDRDEVNRQSDLAPGPVAQYRLARERALLDIAGRQPWWIFEKLGRELPRFLAVSSEWRVFVEDGAYGEVSPASQWLVRLAVGVPWGLAAALGVPGIILLRATRPRVLLIGFLVCYLALHVAAFGHHRYHLVFVPVLTLWAIGVCVEERPAERWRLGAAAILATGVLLCWWVAGDAPAAPLSGR